MTTENPHDPATWRDETGDFAIVEDSPGGLPAMRSWPNPLLDNSPWVLETEAVRRRLESTHDFLKRHGLLDDMPVIEYRRDATYPPNEVLEDRGRPRYPADMFRLTEAQREILRNSLIPTPDGPPYVITGPLPADDPLAPGWYFSNVGQGGTGEYWEPRPGMSAQMVLLLLSLIALGAIAAWIILAAA